MNYKRDNFTTEYVALGWNIILSYKRFNWRVEIYYDDIQYHYSYVIYPPWLSYGITNAKHNDKLSASLKCSIIDLQRHMKNELYN